MQRASHPSPFSFGDFIRIVNHSQHAFALADVKKKEKEKAPKMASHVLVGVICMSEVLFTTPIGE